MAECTPKAFIGAAAGQTLSIWLADRSPIEQPETSKPARTPEPSPGSLFGKDAIWMKQKEVRTLIIREWDRWLQAQSIEPGGPTGKDSLKFFFELQDARSPLLDFQSRGRDKWRVIHSWLLNEERLFE
jgi:hypothetical protein